jgi:hypothetical protein
VSFLFVKPSKTSAQLRALGSEIIRSRFFFGGRPGDNITMGDLIARNLRMVVFTVGWRDVMLGGFFNSARCGVKPRAGLISYLGVFK